MSSDPQFGIRCPDGSMIEEEPWAFVEHADRDVKFWDTECPCEGQHKVVVRTVTISEWEPLDE